MIQVKKKTRNILLIIFGAIVLILAFIPTVIKNYAINNSKELIGRQIDIGTLKYNYFSSTAKVYDFKMFEQNDTDEFTRFDTLIVNIEPIRFFYNEKVIEQFYIKGLMVKTIMKDSTFNFDDLIAFHATSEDSTQTDTLNTEPFKYKLSNLELKDANFFFDDQNVGKETHIEDFSFSIPYVGWDQEKKSNADIKFNFKKGGYFQSVLNVNPVDGEFDAQLTIKDLHLDDFYEYVAEQALINSFKGILNSDLHVTGNTNDAIKSIVSGRVSINDFEMTDNQNKKFLAAKTIATDLKTIDYYNSAYTIESIQIDDSYSYFQLDSISNNFFRIFKLDTEEEPVDDEEQVEKVTDTTSSTNVYYAINNLIVQNGILDYSDNLTGEQFDYHLSDIEVNSKDIRSDSEWLDINADMLLNNRGTLNAKVGLNPSDYTNLNLDFSIENFLLSDINVYSHYYTGHNILEGDFYYYSKSIITNGDIQSENQLLVKNVTVSNEKGGLYSLPLKFALFILKDKNGDVNLDIPVRGDMNDPSVSVGKIVWNTFKNLIIKTAASPVNFLAGLVDGDPKELETLEFTYTDSIPSDNHYRKLDKLLEIETKKEGLSIELNHIIDPNLQNEAIVFFELGKQYFKDTEKDYLKEKEDFENYLRKKVANDSINVKDAAFQIIPTQTADSLSQIYNEALIRNTNEYLKATKPNTNILAIKSDNKNPENVGSLSKFKIKYSMLEEENVKKDSINSPN